MRGRTAMLLAALCALPAPALAQDDGFRARLPEDEVTPLRLRQALDTLARWHDAVRDDAY